VEFVVGDRQLRHILALDLGLPHQHTALALIEWETVALPRPSELPTFPSYNVRTLKRWPLGTPYQEIVEATVRFLLSEPLKGTNPTVVADETGVGRPVVELLRSGMIRARVPCLYLAATISAGHDVQHVAGATWRVPKKTLASVLQVLLQGRRLHVAAELPEAHTLVKELQGFKVRITTARAPKLREFRRLTRWSR
jgi:hypothetical protein